MTATQLATPISPFAQPGSPAYLQATAAYNLAARLQPEAALVATSTDDIVHAVRSARQAGRPVRVLTTGHAARAGAEMTGALLIKTLLDYPVRIDPVRRTARIPAGTRWQAVAEAAAEHGLIALHGSTGTVGAVGYLLRGGLSFYGRQFGLAANSIRSITLVLADGRTVVASDEQQPELFWALRGGGGGFGIVTEVEINLFPMANVITGALFWDARHADVIAPLWTAWTADAPPSATTTMRLMNLPPVPGIPPILTEGQILVIDGAISVQHGYDLEPAALLAADLLEPLRSAATPMLDTWRVAPPRELTLTHMDPPDPLPSRGDSALLHDLGAAGLERLLDAAGPNSGSALTAVEIRQLGGTFAAPEYPGGALDRLPAPFLYLGVGAIGGPSTDESVAADLSRIGAAIAPWRTGFTAPTFVEDYNQVQRSFDDATAQRVAAIRHQFDPEGMFRDDVAPIRDQA